MTGVASSEPRSGLHALEPGHLPRAASGRSRLPGRGAVNWCPGCHTVLANEQVLADGTCERSGDLVERRNLEQWFFRITDYAEELLTPSTVSTGQNVSRPCSANWIGRSEGAEFPMPFAGHPENAIEVFTTRPDTSLDDLRRGRPGTPPRCSTCYRRAT